MVQALNNYTSIYEKVRKLKIKARTVGRLIFWCMFEIYSTSLPFLETCLSKKILHFDSGRNICILSLCLSLRRAVFFNPIPFLALKTFHTSKFILIWIFVKFRKSPFPPSDWLHSVIHMQILFINSLKFIPLIVLSFLFYLQLLQLWQVSEKVSSIKWKVGETRWQSVWDMVITVVCLDGIQTKWGMKSRKPSSILELIWRRWLLILGWCCSFWSEREDLHLTN